MCGYCHGLALGSWLIGVHHWKHLLWRWSCRGHLMWREQLLSESARQGTKRDLYFLFLSISASVWVLQPSSYLLHHSSSQRRGRQPRCLITCLYCSLVANTRSSALRVECSSTALHYRPVAENQANIIKIQGIPFPKALYMEKYP